MKITRTRKMFAVFACIIVMSLLDSSQLFAWTRTFSFEGGTIGQSAKGTNGFDDAGARTTFSSDYAHGGTKSVKMVWQPGDAGFPANMGTVNFSPSVGEGGEIWARGYYYFPAGWSWASNTSGWQIIKTLRLNAGSGGFDSMEIDNTGAVVMGSEPADTQYTYGKMPIGKWVCVELYVKASSSTGIMRLWIDGVLVGEDKTHKTMNSGQSIGYSYVMSYWNQSGPASTESEYLDDFVYTTDTPSNVDAHGNHMIGLINGSPGPNTPTPIGGVIGTVKSK